MMAVVYRNTDGRTQGSIQDIRGAIFVFVAEVVFTSAYSVIHFYPSQMPILRRETNEHIYKFSAYYVAEALCTIPPGVVRSFVSITATYFFVGFYKGLLSYFQFVLTLAVTSFTSHAYGLMLSGIFNSDALTAEIAPPFDLLFLLLAGMYINLNEFPYIRYISVFYFSNEALATLYWYDIADIGKKSRRPEYDSTGINEISFRLQTVRRLWTTNAITMERRYSKRSHTAQRCRAFTSIIWDSCVLG